MGIRNLSSSSIISGIKRSKFHDQSTFLDDFVLIASTTLGSDNAYIELTNIPQIYVNLRLITLIKDKDTVTSSGNGVTRCLVSFNGDTTNANYYNGGMQSYVTYASNGSITSFREATRNSFGEGLRSNETAWGSNIIDIWEYTSIKTKVARSWCNANGSAANGGQVALMSTYWNGTAGISSIRISSESGYNIATGSAMYLYGTRS